jgi:hypothetical protein
MTKPDRRHLQWTCLAFEHFAERKRLYVMGVDTVRYIDTPRLLSKHLQHQKATSDFLRKVRLDERLNLVLRRDTYPTLLRTLHNLAAYH